jgi:SPP1 gp7 family putative phage head morphogenesis protein
MSISKTEKEIIKNYKKALTDIRLEIAKLYEKYADQDDKLTYSQMAKYNQLKNLDKNIMEQLKKTTALNADEIKELSKMSFNEGYYRTAFNIESNVKADLEYGLLSESTIRASVEAKIDKLTLSQRLEKNRRNITAVIRDEITQGLIKGEAYNKMANRIKESLGQDASKALRVARTEAHRNQQNGKLQSMQYAESKGVKMQKRWVSTLDKKTRDSHQSMDGQVVDIDKDFESPSGARGKSPGNLGSAKEDVRCRCDMISFIEGYEPKVRRARDEGIIEYTTYKEWLKQKGVNE